MILIESIKITNREPILFGVDSSSWLIILFEAKASWITAPKFTPPFENFVCIYFVHFAEKKFSTRTEKKPKPF
jgi:hypothetical protein